MALALVPGRLSGLTTAGTLASLACRHAGLLCTRVGGSSSSSGSSRSGDGGSHNGGGSRDSSSSSDTSSSGGGNAGGGGEAASGRTCERPEAARRDVSVDRLTALESEVLALRKALSALQQQQQGQGQQQQGQQQQGQRQHGKGHQGQEQQGEQGEQERQGQQQRQQQQEQRGKMRYQEEHAHGASGGAAGGNGGDSDEGAMSKAASAAAAGDGAGATEAVAEGLGKLHPRITRLVQSGYLESMHHLRQRLMVDEWEGGGRQRAGRRGVADFEAQLAAGEHDGGGDGGGGGGGGGGGQGGGGGGEEGAPGQGGGGRSAPPLSWEQLTQLYEAPDPVKALEAVIPDPRLRMAARATLHRVLDERHEKVHDGATALAKELADSVARGPGDLLGGLVKLLPLPSFLQPK